MFDFLKTLNRSIAIDARTLDEYLEAGMKWLVRAHDATSDGGVAIRYSIFKGWQSSYPETTGYIIPTFLKYFDLSGDVTFKERAIKMAEWELSIQLSDGSFIGGAIEHPQGKLVFDVGQIMFGFLKAFAYSNEEKFLNAAVMAGDWLLSIQDSNGYWVKFSFNQIPHTYHSRVAWALAQLYEIVKDEKYLSAVQNHAKWVLSRQLKNGWFQNAGFTLENYKAPYTHTIAYTIRGLLEIGLIIDDQSCINAAINSADSLLKTIDNDGALGGRYNDKWQKKKNFSCLTGNAQMSIIFFKLYHITSKSRYLDGALAINNYLKSTQLVSIKNQNLNGAIAGSYPIWGEYEHFSYPNWATKFYVDALMLEKKETETLNLKNI